MFDQVKIHEATLSPANNIREEAAKRLGENFAKLLNKEEAWKDLIRLVRYDEDSRVRNSAESAIIDSFELIPEKRGSWSKHGAWNDLHTLRLESDKNAHFSLAFILKYIFDSIPDKDQAWKDLIGLVKEKDSYVRNKAVDTITSIFPSVSKKDRAWKDLIDLIQINDTDIQIATVNTIGSAFKFTADKKTAWEDLHSLINEKEPLIRWTYAKILDKLSQDDSTDLAWKHLITLSRDDDEQVKITAANSLSHALDFIVDKDQAWRDIIELTKNKDDYLREISADILDEAAVLVSEKDRAWKDLIRLTRSDDKYVREKAAEALKIIFIEVKEKKTAWNDLIKLASHLDGNVRSAAADALSQALVQMDNADEAWYNLDKDETWNDLIELTKGDRNYVIGKASEALGALFHLVQDKDNAWRDLHKSTEDENSILRYNSVGAIENAFEYIPDKDQAWRDLIRLTRDSDIDVKQKAADSLFNAILHIQDKEKAWKDLIDLTKEEDTYIIWNTARAIEKAFSLIQDKKNGWLDLLKLAKSRNTYVRQKAIACLGLAFTYVPDKKSSWSELEKLSRDKDSNVRAFANHALGRASVYKATEAKSEDEMKEELENAIKFFNESLLGEGICKPSKFCLPFYRSFYTLTFDNAGNEAEVNKYLEEARSATEGSKIREILIEAVENLSKALLEVQRSSEATVNELKCDLINCKGYCDKADCLLDEITSEKMAPVATKLLKIGKPIIGKNIKKMINDINEKSRRLSENSKGTRSEELTTKLLEIAEDMKALTELREIDIIKSKTKNAQYLDKLSEMCHLTTYDKREEAFELLRDAKEEPNINIQTEKIYKSLTFIDNNLKFARFMPITISKLQKEIIRIATVQINYELTDDFPPKLVDEEETKKKIMSALKKAKDLNTNIICLPELCICDKWLSEIKKQFAGMIVISGSCYDEKNRNVCRILVEEKEEIPPQVKITPSIFEEPELTGKGMLSGAKLFNVYETKFGRFSILICRDFISFCPQTAGEGIDIIFVPSYNSALDRFHECASSQIENHEMYIIISNTAKYGGTSIFGLVHTDHFKRLVQEKCKEKDDKTYKLCEIKKNAEGIIIADFNLRNKSVVRPTPAAASDEKKTVTKIKKIDLE